MGRFDWKSLGLGLLGLVLIGFGLWGLVSSLLSVGAYAHMVVQTTGAPTELVGPVTVLLALASIAGWLIGILLVALLIRTGKRIAKRLSDNHD